MLRARPLRTGDRFSVIYESISHLGKLVRTGRILAAEFVNDNCKMNAFGLKFFQQVVDEFLFMNKIWRTH